jgi:hypothetical protein
MSDLRTAAQQALEALETVFMPHHPAVIALKAALEQPEQTCNCRWVGDVQTQQCTLHEAHVDAIHEWAERAKAAEAKLAALEQPEQEEYTLVAWFNGKPVYSAPPRCSNCASLHALNGELLEALRLIERLTREADGIAINVRDMLGGIARAAIARAEGKV